MSAAAKATGCTQSTVSRQISGLEEELGVDLFERGATGLKLTPAGSNLLAVARSMGQVASDFSLVASLQSDSLEGEVCVSASELIAMHTLAPLLTKLTAENPGLKIKLIATNSVSDILAREADIAVRSFRPTQQGLIARKLREDQYKLYASRSYCDSVTDWNDHQNLRFVGFNEAQKLVRILNEQGLEITLDNFQLASNEHIVHWEMVRQGAGIGLGLDKVGDNDPTIQHALPQIELPKTEVWLVAHRELRTSRRVRLVFDYLAKALSTYSITHEASVLAENCEVA